MGRRRAYRRCGRFVATSNRWRGPTFQRRPCAFQKPGGSKGPPQPARIRPTPELGGEQSVEAWGARIAAGTSQLVRAGSPSAHLSRRISSSIGGNAGFLGQGWTGSVQAPCYIEQPACPAKPGNNAETRVTKATMALNPTAVGPIGQLLGETETRIVRARQLQASIEQVKPGTRSASRGCGAALRRAAVSSGRTHRGSVIPKEGRDCPDCPVVSSRAK